MDGSTHATWVEVDLDAITGNVAAVLRELRRGRGGAAPAVMAVVKADGYGHGAVPVARAALAGGASWLGVARAQEALELREAGLRAPVLLLGHVPADSITELVAAGVSLTAWSAGQAAAIGCAAGRAGAAGAGPARVHLKVDTGMGRIGCRPDEALDLARTVAEADGVELEGLFTHLACADTPDRGATGDQLTAFAGVVTQLASAGLRPPLVHAANSAGTFTVAVRPGHPEGGYDLVRFGIAMYGLSPGAQVPLPRDITSALAWKSVLAQVKQVPPGRGISYGHTYTTTRSERIGTVPVGYADGWRRGAANEVLVGGRRVPVVGRVCMDQCMVNLDAVPQARVGDEVVLVGDQAAAGGGGQRISADDVAQRWGTIGYEVVCGIGRRVPRRYTTADRR